MPRGRMPTPTHLKVLRGNPGQRPLNKREPKPRLGVPDPPAQLDPRAQTEYRRIVDEMRQAAPALLTQLDDTELAIFSESKVQYLDLLEKLHRDKKRLKVIDRFDVVMLTKFAQQMHAAGDRLGLSPSARTRLQMPPPGEHDDDDF